MAILLILTIMAWHIMGTDLINIGVYSKNRKMLINSERGIEKYALVQKLWAKQNRLLKYDHFLSILALFWTKSDHSKGSTSHAWVLKGHLYVFESVDQGKCY